MLLIVLHLTVYKNNQSYESLINKFKNMQKPTTTGISNSAAVFLLNGLKLLNGINKKLKNHTNNATIDRIIFTDKLNKKSPENLSNTYI